MTDEIWTRAALKDVVDEWVTGSTPPRTNPEFFVPEGGTPWVKAEDVKGGLLYETAEHLSEAGGRQMRRAQKNAVLVTTTGTIGKVAVAGRPVFCNQAVQALSFRKDTVLPQYGRYFLLSQQPLLLQLANGTTIPNVSKGKLQSLPIYFPSIPVQKKIVAQMRMPEMLREKAEQIQRLLKQYLPAMTIQAARRTKTCIPIGELLAEPPLTGLRAKASPTGYGLPLVNRLSRDGGRLTGLEGCLRVQVPEKQLSRYRLRPMDILLRNSAPGDSVRGTLVGDLPEEALTGGNLTRLRLRSSLSAAWLLSWLRGPGGDPLYVDGKLQKQMLQQYRVPVPQGQKVLERRLLLYFALEEKAVQFTEQTQALFDSVLRLIFSKSGAETDFEALTGGHLDRSLSRLTEPMNQFLQEMSQFQRELYRVLLQSEEGQPVHALLKQMRRGVQGRGRAAGIQDALASFALLEQFGLVEHENARKILLFPAGTERTDTEPAYVTDHNGRSVLIDTYKPTEDIFEENAYAAGADQGTKL